VSDSFDGDPDDFFEPDEEDSLGPDDPAEEYEEGSLGTAAPQPPSPEVPEVGVDSDAVMDYDEVDPTLRRFFWLLVLAIKFTLLSLTLGLLFIFFEGNTVLGGQLLAFGVLLASYSIYRYRDVRARIEAGEIETADGTDESERAEETAADDTAAESP